MADIVAPVDGSLVDVNWAIDITQRVNDNTAALSVSTPGAQLRRVAAFAMANNATTIIDFDTDDIDTANAHSTVTNTSRYVIPLDGIYWVAGGIGYAANATGLRTAQLFKNGTSVPSSQTKLGAIASVPTSLPIRGVLLSLVAGDYLEVGGFQNSGGSLNTTTEAEGMPALTVVLVIH